MNPYTKLDLEQGSDKWKQTRFDHITASQIPTLFGVSPYQKLEALLEEKLTRKEKEHNSFKLVLFDHAHKAEAACRTWVENDLGKKFPPAVLISNKTKDLLASLDGFNEDLKLIFEAKYMGSKSIAEIKEGKIKEHHLCQIQAQLYASGAEKCIYFAIDKEGDAAMAEIYPDDKYYPNIKQKVSEFMIELKKRKEEPKVKSVAKVGEI